MIFSYWTAGVPDTGNAMPKKAVVEWKRHSPEFTVFSDAEVLPLLKTWDGEGMFEDIRIPACRSDIARLVLLYEYGGLYVDAHCAPGALDRLALLFERLSKYELVVFDESVDSPEYRFTCMINGVLCARAKANVLDTLIRRAFSNLRRHRARELSSGGRHVSYSIYKLTGPWMIWHELFRRATIGGELKPRYRDCVAIWPYDRSPAKRPVRTDQHGGYRHIAHWSEREKTEPLFLATHRGANP